MSTGPRSRFGILSAEILKASELLPLIDTMTIDEQIIVHNEVCTLGRVIGICLHRIAHAP